MGSQVAAGLQRRLSFRERIVWRRARRERDAEFFFRYAGDFLADKWLDLKQSFERVVALTPRDDALLPALVRNDALRRIGQLTLCEPSEHLARLLEQNATKVVPTDLRARVRIKTSLQDETDLFDAALSFFSLHWQQDLQQGLTSLAALLKPNRPFYAVMFGEGTLGELTKVLLQAESRLRTRVCMRVLACPSLEFVGNAVRDLPFLSQPFVERFYVEADYADLWALLRDVQVMGESGMVSEATPLSREMLVRANDLYPRSSDGRIVAEFHGLVLHGWTASAL